MLLISPQVAECTQLRYSQSTPPLEVTFSVEGGHYNGSVTGGNLFLQTDIGAPPMVRWNKAKRGKFYTLMMLDFDGNADGSWPDQVPPGANSPVRHWIVGNIPGSLLAGPGYKEFEAKEPEAKEPKAKETEVKETEAKDTKSRKAELKDAKSREVEANKDAIQVLQAYRSPHIPVVSDRYGLYIFEQSKLQNFAPVYGPITNFDYSAFTSMYGLRDPDASNFFVAVYTSESPFSGKMFHGNDVAGSWHKKLGLGSLDRK
ncbi:MAG TPA: hypothetical protein V6C89_08620 [Drouetiella sp.]